MDKVEITKEQLLDIFYPTELMEDENERDFNLPIRWSGGDFYKELYFLFKEYRKRIDNRLKGDEYKEYRDDIKIVCQSICQAVSYSFCGNSSDAYASVEKIFNEVLKDKYKSYICYFGGIPLYRCSDVGNKGLQDRKRMFHVPFNLRSKMSTQRYSIPGYPSLYLGTSIELNCMEIGKSMSDSTVMAARFKYCPNEQFEHNKLIQQFFKTIYIIDLSVKPSEFEGSEDEERKDNASPREKLYKELSEKINLLDYLPWYPLIAACSFIRISRTDPYSAEYIIPQLVMQWAKRFDEYKKSTYPGENEHGKPYCGVCYFSCLSKKASKMGLNYVFPSSGSDTWVFDDIKNYCPILAANFKLTEPVFVSEYNDAAECENDLCDDNKITERIGTLSRDKIKEEIKKENGEYSIPDGEDIIPDYTFSGLEKLTKINIPESVTNIGHFAFTDCTELNNIKVDNSNKKYYDNSNCIIERETGKLIFGFKNSVIPNDGSVTSIGDLAFYECDGLTSIDIPNSVTSIGASAFSRCSGLTSIDIPNSVTSIGEWAFKGCSGLTSIDIPNSVTSIEDFTFSECSGLTSIDIPNSVTSIEDFTFSECSGLISIDISNSVTSIGMGAFRSCSGLESIDIPSSVTIIRAGTFSSCSGLTSIDIPNSVTSIGEWAFNSCSGLTSIEIPNSVTSIGSNAFYGCSGLTSLTIPDSVTSIGYFVFAYCTNLTITVPRRFEALNNHAFYGCKEVIYYDP